MYFQLNANVSSLRIELRSKSMPPIEQVTKTVTDRLHRMHPRIGVRCIPSSSLSPDNDEPLVYEIVFDPQDGVQTTAASIISAVQVALHNTFRASVSATSNLVNGR